MAGRPHNSFKKRTFKETNLGRLLFLLEPAVFEIICPKNKLGFAPDLEIIKQVISSIDNDSFKSKRFISYLKEYESNGLHVKRAKKITQANLEHFYNLRLRRAKAKIKSRS